MRPRVLIVDDDRSLASLMAVTLGRDGFEVTTAGSLREARTLMGPFDVIVADVRLPNGDGRHLRDDWPAVPMLVISGAPTDDPPEIADGTVPFLAKPFMPAMLRDFVRSLLVVPE